MRTQEWLYFYICADATRQVELLHIWHVFELCEVHVAYFLWFANIARVKYLTACCCMVGYLTRVRKEFG